MNNDDYKPVQATYVFKSESRGCQFPGMLLLLFVGIPAIELVLLIELHSMVGLIYTIGLIVITGIVGAGLAKFQGLMTIDNIRTDMAEGRIPAPHIIDGVMILIAAALLVTPGILTDITGFMLLTPPIRALIRQQIRRAIEKKFSNPVIDIDDAEC